MNIVFILMNIIYIHYLHFILICFYRNKLILKKKKIEKSRNVDTKNKITFYLSMNFYWLIFPFIYYYNKLIRKSIIQFDGSFFIKFTIKSSFDEILSYKPYSNFVYFELMPSFNFSLKWIKESHQLIQKSQNTQFCPICNFKQPPKQQFFEDKNTKKHNLIMTIYVKSIYCMFVLARSLRTTKSQAKIVYFVDSTIDSTFSEDDHKLFQNCGITIINYGEAPEPLNCLVNYRFILFSEFMNRYYHRYQKVIIVDGFDTAFQSDPFEQYWKEYVVYLTLENNNNIVTQGWYLRLYPNEKINDVLYSQIINNGVIAAFSNVMVRYLDFFTRSYDWEKWNDTLDQALVNYLYYKGKFKEAGIKIELIDAGDGFLASIYNRYGNVEYQKLGLFDPKSKAVFPSLIHKFSEPRNFGKNVYLQCPRLSWQKNLSQYIRGLSFDMMNSLDRK